MIIEGVEVDWPVAAHRVLHDGRVALVIPQLYNAMLNVSTPAGWKLGIWEEAW
ncbi:MAG TPA: hypothetical protein VF731_01760 [Solirubrobacterales bacterium]